MEEDQQEAPARGGAAPVAIESESVTRRPPLRPSISRPHDRFPDMLESLDRVARTVNNLRGRCTQLSRGTRALIF